MLRASAWRLGHRTCCPQPGLARLVQESALRVARAQLLGGGSTHDDCGSSEQVRGWCSTWAVEEAARVLDPWWSRLERRLRRAACSSPTIYCCLIIHSVLQITGLVRATCKRRPMAFILFFFTLSHSSWERDIGRLPGSCSGQLNRSPYLTLISESPGSGCGQGRRQLGTKHQTPARLKLGPLGQLSRSPQLNLISESELPASTWAAGSSSDQLQPDSGAWR